MANGYARYNGLSGGGGSGAGVSSLNGETGAVNIVAGTGISVTPSGQNITIASTGSGSGTVTSVSVVSSNGLAGTVATATTTPAITLSTTITGLLQGNGTAISAATTGNLTDVGTDGIVVTGGTGAVLGSGTSIAQAAATASQNGYLKSVDWTTFNNKQTSGNYITALTGDITATGPGSVAASLTATTNSTLTALPNLVTVGTIGTGTWAGTTVATNHGGTGVTSVTTSPTASSFVGWDANKDISANSFIFGYTTTAAVGSTTTLTSSSTEQQYFTGTMAQTVIMPVTSTLVLGQRFTVTNLSTGIVTVQSSGGNNIQALARNQALVLAVVLTTGTTAASWSWEWLPANSTPHSVAMGGTSVASVTINPTASSFAGWDANKNLSANATIDGFTTTATAAGTTTMTIASTKTQYFTGVTTQTIKLPTTSVVAGIQYLIENRSTGLITIQSSGSNTIQIMAANTSGTFTALVATPTTAANWDCLYSSINGGKGAYGYFASTQVTTASSNIVSGTFTTFSNSPALAFTPTVTGTYKVYCGIPLQINGVTAATGAGRIILTSGTGSLLQESQSVCAGPTAASLVESSGLAQSVYTLTSGTAYVFDIQGSLIVGNSVANDGLNSPFYMFAELI